MKNKLALIIILTAIVSGFALLTIQLSLNPTPEYQSENLSVINSSPQQAKDTPSVDNKQAYWIKASFSIITKGTTRIFTDPKYHHLSEDVYIESPNPNIVNVKKTGLTWNDFFKTLPVPMKLNKDCLTTGTDQLFCTGKDGVLEFYLNDKLEMNLLDKEIKQDDKVLIRFK